MTAQIHTLNNCNAPASANPDRHYRYGFQVAEYRFLIPEQSSGSLLESPPIFPLPNTVSWLLGLVNDRGNLVPVYDLGAMLNMNIRAGKKMVMTVVIEGKSMGFRCDGGLSADIAELKAARQPNLPKALAEFTSAIYQNQHNTLLEFDFKRCLETYMK